jgi:hypothetical protein
MKKARSLIPILAAAVLLAAASPTSSAASLSNTAPGAAGQSQRGTTEADLARWTNQLTLPPHVTARLDWARRSFVPSGYQKLESLARAKAPAIAAGKDFDSLEKETALDRVFTAAGITGLDASEAAFLVLAMATKDMDDDLRLIMAEIKATNAAKQKLRDQINDLNKWISEKMAQAGDEATVSGKPPVTAARAQPKTPALRALPFQKVSSPVLRFEYVKAPTIPRLPPRRSDLSVASLKSLLDKLNDQLDGLNELSEMTSLRLQMTMDRRSKFVSTLSQIMKKMSTTQDALIQNLK